VKTFCVRPIALHHQKPEKDKQNVDFAPPGNISADARGWDPIFADPGVCDRKTSEMRSSGCMLQDHP